MQVDQRVVSVSQLNAFMKNMIQRNQSLNLFYIKGEILSLKQSYSGHCYFDLKDTEVNSTVRCVFFRSALSNLTFKLANGQEVVCLVKADFYEQGGDFQLKVNSVFLSGVGARIKQKEEVEARLQAEGLFAQERKRPLPLLPEQRVAVITSDTGAVIRDIIEVARNRFQFIDILLLPVRVQGKTAVDDMLLALQEVNKRTDISVVIIGRGGGSMDDLWCFNDEQLARAVANCRVPIVSSVGHEVDYTICDAVADVRASTPSHAAELVFPVRADYCMYVNNLVIRQQKALTNLLLNRRKHLELLLQRSYIKDVFLLVNEKSQIIDRMQDRLRYALASPVHQARLKYNLLNERLQLTLQHVYQQAEHQYKQLFQRLKSANPLLTLDRGYAYVTTNGQKVEKVQGLKVQQQLSLRMIDGSVICTIDECQLDNII